MSDSQYMKDLKRLNKLTPEGPVSDDVPYAYLEGVDRGIEEFEQLKTELVVLSYAGEITKTDKDKFEELINIHINNLKNED